MTTVLIETLRLGSEDQNCGSCYFWSQWLENTGDCMRYASKRRDAYGGDGPVPPAMSAKATSGGQVCDDFEARPAPTHKACSACRGTGKVPA